MSFQVIFSREAAGDLVQLFDHLLDRELRSATGNLHIPVRAIQAIEHASHLLSRRSLF